MVVELWIGKFVKEFAILKVFTAVKIHIFMLKKKAA
jgi:hypothetical protein